MTTSGIGLSGSGITFGGLASGLDTGAIIEALLAVERRPIRALESKRQSFQTQKSLFSDLEQKLQALKDAADGIRKSTNFLEYKATVDEETFFSATASSAASAGSYTISVDSLAQAQVSHTTSGTHTSGTEKTITGGASAKLTFSIGGGSPIDVDITEQTNSLEDIAAAINSKEMGIKAQVLQASTDDYQLVLTGETGEAKAFTVTGSGSPGLITMASQLSANTAMAASDAEITVNGIAVKRNSNQMTDVIPGVTLDLHAKHSDPNPDSVLTISTDTSATASKVQDFVNAYNGVLDFMQAQSVFDTENNEASSPLFGDSTLRSIRSSLRTIAGASVDTGNTAYQLLSQIGVTSDREGRLTFTQTDFEEAVTADEEAVEALFTAGTSGLATRFYDQTDTYLDTVDGILVARQKGYDSRISDIDDQIELAERRLEQAEVSLTARFSNLEVLLAQLQSQGASLNGLAARSAFGG